MCRCGVSLCSRRGGRGEGAPESPSVRNLIDQVVLTALPETKNDDEVFYYRERLLC